MNRTVQFTVPGAPQPKQRARQGNGGHWYTPEETRKYEAAVGVHGVIARMKGGWVKADPSMGFEVWINVYFPDQRGRDIDNVAKSVLDALNLDVWKDDRQVVRLVVERHLDRVAPRTEIAITRMEPLTLSARGGR
jgi:Holliday junction resolvase RusA-like endonuclease